MLRWSRLFALATSKALGGAVITIVTVPLIIRAIDYVSSSFHLTYFDNLKGALILSFSAAALMLLAAGLAHTFCPTVIKRYHGDVDQFKKQRLELNHLEESSAKIALEKGATHLQQFFRLKGVSISDDKKDFLREKLRDLTVPGGRIARSEDLEDIWAQLEIENLYARAGVALSLALSFGIAIYFFARNVASMVG